MRRTHRAAHGHFHHGEQRNGEECDEYEEINTDEEQGDDVSMTDEELQAAIAEIERDRIERLRKLGIPVDEL